MIRINLIGQKAKVKGASPKVQILFYVGLLVIEAVVLAVWHQQLSSELTSASRRTREATAKIEDLRRVKDEWGRWQTEKADLDRQSAIFETLKADQIGPPSMLQFLSYVLSPVPEGPGASDEIKAQELAGWNPRWDARRVWLRQINEKGGVVSIRGEALDHEDVAEFYRRMESADFFSRVEPGVQSRRYEDALGVNMVEFSVTANLTYKVLLDAEPAKVETQATAQPAADPAAAPSGTGTAAAPK